MVRIFNPASGEVVHSISEPTGGGDRSKIEFSPDGKTLLRLYSNSTKTRNQFIVHRVDTWEAVWGLTILPLSGMSLAVSSHGNMAAIGGITLGPGVVHNAQILIVDLTSRRITRTIDNAFPPENQVEQLAWSADGTQLAASGIVGGSYSVPDAVRIFDVATGAQVAGEPVFHRVCNSSDGSYLGRSAQGATTDNPCYSRVRDCSVARRHLSRHR